MRLARWVLTITVALVPVGCASSTDDGAPARSPGAPTTVATASTADVPVTVAELPDVDDATVERVVDGDTIVLRGGERVRLIGIDTPETKDPRREVQCFGEEASRRTSTLLPGGEKVRLVYDVERHDRYDRTLAYVYRASDGLFVNAALVRDGYASAYTYPPNVAHADELVALQREARDAGRGLWGTCEADGDRPTTTDGNSSATQSGSGAGGGTGCDSAYPGVCIPPPPPDLDCGDVDHRRFRVLPPDPHRFDADGNGVGCEGG